MRSEILQQSPSSLQGFGLGREGLAPLGPDAAQIDTRRRQPLIRIVGAQAQAVLGARGEHAVGLGDAARNQVVDHHAQVGVRTRNDELSSRTAGLQRGVDARGNALGPCFLVARGAVDLTCQEQPRQALHFQRREQLARIDVIVFDGVAEALDGDLLQARESCAGRPPAPPRGARWRRRWDRPCRRRDPRAPGKSDAQCGQRSAPPCPRWRDNSAAPRSRSARSTWGSGDRLARMMAWVASVVVVTPQWICALVIRWVRNENGVGTSSPGCISRLAQSMEALAKRAGVPVLRRPRRRSSASSRSESLLAGASPWRPAGVFSSPAMDQAAQESSCGENDGARPDLPAIVCARSRPPRRDPRSGPRPRASMTSRLGMDVMAACMATR